MRERGLYPINHTVVVKDELLAEHPDLAADLFHAFAEAKRGYVRRLAAGDAGGGVSSLREAVRLAPEMAEAHRELALALDKQGQKAEARKHFDEARRLAPHLQAQPRAAARSEAALPVPQP